MIEMSPNPAGGLLGLTSNSDKTGSGQERDLGYRTMVDAGLTFTGRLCASLPLMAFAAARNIAMPGAIILALTLVIRLAAARRPGSDSKQTYATGKQLASRMM
jgi:hypothetical protein